MSKHFTQLGHFKHLIEDGLSYLLHFDNGLVKIEQINNKQTHRICISKHSDPTYKSYAIKQANKLPYDSAIETASDIEIKNELVSINISKHNGYIDFLNSNNELILSDEMGLGVVWDEHEITNYKSIRADERFFGLGATTGALDKRGQFYTCWNTDQFGYHQESDPLYASIPFYIAYTEGKWYGIFLDNTFKTHFNFGASNQRFSFFQAENGILDYYFLNGNSIEDIISSYTTLTGTYPFIPKWALGYQQCRYSYYPKYELELLADTFRKKQIPCDVLYFDIHYMDDYKVFTINNSRFDDMKSFNQSLHQKGFKTVAILDPGIKKEKGYQAYETGLEKNVFLKYPDQILYEGEAWPGICHFPDFSKTECIQWWADLVTKMKEHEFDGFWNDMNEPAVWGKNFPNLVAFDLNNTDGNHKQAHNIYGMLMSKATAQGIKNHNPNLRVFNLTRATFSGGQSYALIWTGDNTSNNDHLLLGVRLINSLGLSGFPISGNDIGGFIGEPSPELYARWIQVGTFSPFFRGHTMVNSRDAEPWSFGEEIEDIARNFINLRYKLIPYLYSKIYEKHSIGLPICKSLIFEEADNSIIYQNEFQHQFLFCDQIMVFTIMGGQYFTKIYFPNTTWYDMFTDSIYYGSITQIIETPKEKIPIFIKEGSIIFIQDNIQSTSLNTNDTLEIHIYYSENKAFASQLFYDDNGIDHSFKSGNFFKKTISMHFNTLIINISNTEGHYQSQYTKYTIYLHGFPTLNTKNIEKSTYKFIEPISNFDPYFKNENNPNEIKNLQFIRGIFQIEETQIKL